MHNIARLPRLNKSCLPKRPLLLGIAGGTGSGKTTLAQRLKSDLGANRVLVLSLDDFYRDLAHCSLEERERVNFDHPDSIEASLAARTLQQLKLGRAVSIPEYSFYSHTRTGHRPAIAAGLVVLEGLFPHQFRRVWQLLDYLVFAWADTHVRFLRRVERDVRDRGRTRAFSESQFWNTSQPMHEIFVEGAKYRADFIFRSEGARRGQDYLRIRRIIKSRSGL